MAREAAGMRSAKKKKPTLVIIFNWPHVENIPKLERFYGNRFSRIFYILPDLSGPGLEKYREQYKERGRNLPDLSSSGLRKWRKKYKQNNIFSSEHSTATFQGAISGGFKYYHSENTSNYIFCADDLLLNPLVNEDNYQKFFKMNSEESYINTCIDLENAHSLLPWKSDNYITNAPPQASKDSSRIITSLRNCYRTFWDLGERWTRHSHALHFRLVQAQGLPSRKEAIQTFKKYDLHTEHVARQGLTEAQGRKTLTRYRLRRCFRATHGKGLASKPFIRPWAQRLFKLYTISAMIVYLLTGKDSYRPEKLDYPLAMGFSDIVLVPPQDMHKFARFCGYFAKAKLFCEIAIPTSLVLAQAKIRQKKDLDHKVYEHGWFGHPPLPPEKRKNISSIVKNWPKEYLYIHPVKLSQVGLNKVKQ